MRIQPPITSLCRLLVTNTIRLKDRPARLLVLLGSLTMAATALAAVASPAGAFRQLIFGVTASATRSHVPEPKAALFDPLLAVTPQSGSSTMTVARRGHTATRLSDGRVLIVGGENADGFVTAAEIFDPATGTFSLSGNLNTPRTDHTAMRLADGRVLIAGGRGALGSLNSTEIFDPASGAFTPGPNLNSARSGQSATALSDGRIVFVGGDAAGSVEIFEPSANAFTSFGANLLAPRAQHGAVLLNDGRILSAGGTAADGSQVLSGEILDVANASFTAVSNDTEDSHVRPTLRVLPDGKVQVVGSSDHEDMEIYDPAINAFGAHAHVFPTGDDHPELVQQILSSPTRAAMFHLGASSALLNREGQTITELPGSNQALVVGGVDSNGNFLSSSSVLNSSPATVTTDKLDYPPGTPVIVSGTGWQPNESVTITLHEDPHVDTENPHTFTVQADGNGNFTFQEYAPEEADLGVSYIVAAVGQSSGLTAQTSFHDSASANVNFATSGLPDGVSITVDTAFTNNGGHTSTLSVTFITPLPSADTGTQPGSSFSYTFPSSVTVSGTTYNFSSGSPSSPFTTGAAQSTTIVTGTYVPACTAPAVTTQPTGQTVTYGAASVSFSSTASGTPAPTVQWQVSTNGGGTFTDLSNTAPYSGVTTGTLTITSPTVSLSTNQYRAVFANTCDGPQTATSNAATLTVNKKTVTGSFTADNKVYNGNNSATILTRTITPAGIVGSDVVTLNGGTATFSDKNVANGKTVTGAGFTLGGADAGNYALGTVATTTADITPLHITGSFTADNKIYDGNNSATVLTRSLSGAFGGDTVSLTGGTATFADKNVGTGKTVTLTGASLTGADAGNYVLDSVSTTTADITALHITGSFTASNKIYDGNNSAAVLTRSLSGAFGGDTVSLTGGTATFADKNVGTGKTVTLTGASLTGADAGNYVLDSVATTTADITALHITGSFTASNKVYDGSNSATVLTRSTVGDVGGVSLDGGTAIFDNKNVGIGKTVTLTGASLTGADTGNYVLDSVSTTTADITAIALTATVAANNKPYDGNATATISSCSFGGVIGGDTVTCETTGYSAAFDNKNVGTAKPVTTGGLGKSGADAGNYTFSGSGTGSADITALHITGSFTAGNKVYDGNNSATVLTRNLSGTIGSDNVQLSGGTATFSDKTVATAKTVALTGASLAGTDAGNYVLDSVSTTTADITRRDLTVTATGVDKVYDGTANATVTLSDDRVVGDVFTDNYTSATFADKNVGNGKSITVTGISISGIDAGNYDLTNTTTSASANITAKALTGSISADDKVYDGNNSATILTHTLSGVIGLDDVTYVGGAATFANKNVGNGKIVTATGLSLSGGDASNYSVNGTAMTTANMTPKGLTVSGITANNKVYDGNTTATLNTGSAALVGVVAGDLVTLNASGATGTFDNSNVGTNKTVTVSGLTISGSDAGNYTLTQPTTTASILYSLGTCLGETGHSILQPINVDGSSVFKQKSTVPAKFRVCDANGNSVGTPGVVTNFYPIRVISGTQTTTNETVDSTTPDTTFRWDSTAQQWIFNINTKSLSANQTYIYRITLADGSLIDFQYGLK